MTNLERIRKNNQKLDECISKANNLPNIGNGEGAVSVKKKDVNFYDYDGTLLYSYTVGEAQALTELPPLPSQPGLICQEWNYDLETVKSYNRPIDIGATYITDDGKTRLYINVLNQSYLTVQLCISTEKSNSEFTIDWGDGAVETFTSSTDDSEFYDHYYLTTGEYVINIDCKETQLCANLETLYEVLERAEIGANFDFDAVDCVKLKYITIPVNPFVTASFYCCHSLRAIILPKGSQNLYYGNFYYNTALEVISIPHNISSISGYAFYYCMSLRNLTLPEGLTTINDDAFSECYGLNSIVFPSSLLSISGWAFNGTGLSIFDFSCAAIVPSISYDTIVPVTNNFVIKVPSALYDEWISATNWCELADLIVPVAIV